MESDFEKKPKMNFTKIIRAELDSVRQELSNGGLGIAVALLVRPAIDFFVCFYWGSNPTVLAIMVRDHIFSCFNCLLSF